MFGGFFHFVVLTFKSQELATGAWSSGGRFFALSRGQACGSRRSGAVRQCRHSSVLARSKSKARKFPRPRRNAGRAWDLGRGGRLPVVARDALSGAAAREAKASETDEEGRGLADGRQPAGDSGCRSGGGGDRTIRFASETSRQRRKKMAGAHIGATSTAASKGNGQAGQGDLRKRSHRPDDDEVAETPASRRRWV
ncbi:hypothetical protein Bcep1808_2115 [Burkholderia vietnamiensis G4]|uniref:Uncharacterized protein n=1 Tax=Burkholderia vietnamiensis (strain G4 / LMG 22486) TaxID=269482 RepID=A4JFR4_BURVG|nr:hypothetical protein Bcep1808_2115 [Burkholderia vietnamiensis G4]